MRILLHGNLHGLSSFSIVNRHLLSGLRGRGHSVDCFASDGPPRGRANPPVPDVYVCHGHPWQPRAAPGILNVFALNYESLSPDRELRDLIARLNAAFDLVVVPAPFLQHVLASGGLHLAAAVVPWGFDPHEFGPPRRRVQKQPFVFLHAAAVNRRKGTDVLVDAYLAEFDPGENVELLIKEAPRHPTWEGWADHLERRCQRADRARIVWIRAAAPTLAPYFARADVGVFPHRGEGFGLPVLECIASGRRVIVTGETGPESFCEPDNAWLVRARHVRRNGRIELEPSVRHLRSLLRVAYEQGKPGVDEARAVARTVAGWTWRSSVTRLERICRQHLRQQRRRRARRASMIVPRGAGGAAPSTFFAPAVVYAFHSRGTTSWKKVCSEIDRGLRSRFTAYRGLTARDRFDSGDVDIIVGQSEHCLEALLAARRRNSGVLAVVHQECTVLGDRVAIVNRERSRCGVAPIEVPAIDLWRNRMENELADAIVVGSSVARRCFLANGFASTRIHVVRYGIRHRPFHFRARARTTRFLFVGTDPFRKGIRHLFEAWERAALVDAELICLTDLEVLRSKLLLGYLVRNPSIAVRPLLPQRAFMRQYREIDCQVLPSLEDTFSVAVADGMGIGKPAIVSTATGIADLITHDVDGHIVGAGDVDALASSLTAFATDRQRLRTMGAAAHATAGRYGWERFRRTIAALVQSLWSRAQ